jgi:RNA-directed DNA polymerase
VKQESPASADKAKPGRETTGGQPQDLWWAEASIWTDRMVSALGNGVKGGKWFSLIDKVVRPATLDLAWQRVARNRGAAGVDGQSVERFSFRAERCLAELQASLADGSYRPQPVKRVEIPKPDGKTRPLGIPTVKDRIVQTAVKMVIEPIFEVQFRPGSFGFRPGRGCKDALREVDRLLKAGYTHVVDADLKSYFDTIPHDRLMAVVEDQRRSRAGADRWLPATGDHIGHGALATGDGNAPRGGAVAAAGQSVSASARCADGTGRLADGAIRR